MTKKTAAVITAMIIASSALLFLFIPIPEKGLNPPQSYRFYDKEDQLIGLIISKDDAFRMHIPVSEISPLFIKTLILIEDQHFYNHLGVNPLAIIRASVQNISNGRIVSGASTITMQLARMLKRRDRTLFSKVIEAVVALKLELKYTKEEILAAYIANAPYGGNVEGIQAAAFFYFNKPASALSAGEIALLVAIPRSPSRLRPDRHPDAAKRIRDRVLAKMLEARLISDETLTRNMREKIVVKKKMPKTLIPHYAWRLRQQHPEQYVWKTTIDENYQLRVQKLLQNHIATLITNNITNAAAVVVDNRTREVRALVGSLDYFSKEALGANDGSMSLRSPGSTLKPFLYGLAFEEGMISEKTMLYDIPVNYAGYSPQNYSKDFSGLVRVDEALVESLNVVAVRMSRELGHKKLYNLLLNGGIKTLDKPAIYYGLPLILGGVETRLTELVGLYCALANKGEYRPIQFLQNDEPGEAKKLLSEESSWFVSYLLKQVERPDFPESWQFAKNRPDIAWKTGTSYGHQDAWSIGYTPELTIGVWVGNFDGSPSKGLAGRSVAAPILFDLFQALAPVAPLPWFTKPDKVKLRNVCQTSGLKPSRHCTSLMKDFVLEGANGKAVNQTCTIHQEIALNKTTGQQATEKTRTKEIQKTIFEVWPSEVATFLLRHGVPVHNSPPYLPGNMAGQKYYPPKILSPVKNTIHYKRPDKFKPEEHGIKLQAAATNRVRKGFWFLDDTLVGETDLTKDIIINPPPGNYLVKFVDDTGGTATVRLSIKDIREIENKKQSGVRMQNKDI